MAFPNEIIFCVHLLLAGLLLLGAARLGRAWLTGLILVCTILMNIVVMKQMRVFGLEVTGGNVLFATVFLANDVLNEHYGRKAARTAVWIGFAGGLAVVALMQPVLWYLPGDHDDAHSHLTYFFHVTSYGRIVVASMLSYLLAQMLDIRLYDRLRRWSGANRLLWLRSNVSTWFSQAFDTVFFTTVALTGSVIQSWPEWVDAVVFAYVIKIAVATVNTGFLYLTTWPPLRPSGSRLVEKRS